VELIATTINHLLDGSSRYQGNGNGKSRGTSSRAEAVPGAGGKTPLENAPQIPNVHHMLVAPQCALPEDAAGNPWSGSYVYASGNLTLDLLYNLMLEATGRLQKCVCTK
jgi:Mn-containing catalase